MLLLALAMPWTAKAQSGNITFTDANVVVTIGDEASNYTYANMPVVMNYNYSLTQQIYTAAELGNMAGIITSIAFDYAYTEPFSMAGMKVYMKNINKTSFDSDTDMVDLSDATMVYDGSFAASEAGWVTLQLQTPFFYNGTSNLLLCCYDPTNGYPGYDYKFRSTPAAGPYCYLSYFGDNAIPDLNDISSYSASKFRDIHRNNIRLTMGGSSSTATSPTNGSGAKLAIEATLTSISAITPASPTIIPTLARLWSMPPSCSASRKAGTVSNTIG